MLEAEKSRATQLSSPAQPNKLKTKATKSIIQRRFLLQVRRRLYRVMP